MQQQERPKRKRRLQLLLPPPLQQLLLLPPQLLHPLPKLSAAVAAGNGDAVQRPLHQELLGQPLPH